MQKVRSHPTAGAPTVCMYAVSGSISLPSRGSFRLSFTVLVHYRSSQYWFTIGRSRVFSLGGWSPHLQTGCHVSRPTYRFLSTTRSISHTGLSPSIAGLSRPFCCRSCYQNTGLLQFRSPLLSQSRLISFPGAT